MGKEANPGQKGDLKDKKEGDKADGVEKKEEKKVEKKPLTYGEELAATLELVHTGVQQKNQRHLNRAVRNVSVLRRKLQGNVGVLAKYVQTVLSGTPNFALLMDSLGNAMDADMTPLELPAHKFEASMCETEAFLGLLVVVHLIDSKQVDKAVGVCEALVERLKAFNRRTLDAIAAQIYFYFSRAYELQGRLAEIRQELLAAYRTSCLHHDFIGQGTLLNLLLRNYLHFHLYDLATKLVSKTAFPENLRSNAQQARYLYYIGRIKAVQLEYSDAHAKLMQAIRKAPQGPKTALGFRLAAQKLAIVVELLMGDIPDRALFNTPELKAPLAPYREVVQAVRSGDLNAFQKVMVANEARFTEDGTLFLVRRLHHNVIKAGLRLISLSYSRIALADVARKLGLESAQDAEGIVSKAILDGVIEATIDHERQFVQSKSSSDVYASSEPLRALHKRVAFCLQLHNDTVKAMQYPDEQKDRMQEAEERRKAHEEAVARAEEAEEDGDDFGI